MSLQSSVFSLIQPVSATLMRNTDVPAVSFSIELDSVMNTFVDKIREHKTKQCIAYRLYGCWPRALASTGLGAFMGHAKCMAKYISIF